MANLEYLIEQEVMPVLKDIADSLKKIANPAYTPSTGRTFRVRFGDQIGIYDTTTGNLVETIQDPKL